MMHMMRWSRPDIHNMTQRTHYNAMVHIIDYCMTTPQTGLVLNLHGDWEGISMDYKFEVTVKKNFDYAKCLDRKKSISGGVVYLNGAPVMFRSSTQKMVSLSTTEAELNAVVMGVKDALFVKNIL